MCKLLFELGHGLFISLRRVSLIWYEKNFVKKMYLAAHYSAQRLTKYILSLSAGLKLFEQRKYHLRKLKTSF